MLIVCLGTIVFSQSSLYLKRPFDLSVFSDEVTAVDFTWNDDASSSYTLELADEPTFASPISFNTSGNSYTVNQASLYPTINYWRVTGDNGTTVARSFEIIDLNSFGTILYHIDANSNVVVSSGEVSSWGNKANSSYEASQGTGPLRPDFEADVINEKPAVRFGGIAGTAPHYLTLPDIDIMDTNFTFFFVNRQFTENASVSYILSRSSPLSGVYSGGSVAGGINFALTNGAPNIIRLPGQMNFNWEVKSAHWNRINVNGTAATGLFGDGVDKIRFNTIGNRSDATDLNFHGDLAEIILYTNRISNADQELVDNYLITKYSPYPDLGSDINTCASSVQLGPVNDPAYSSITWSNGQTDVATINADASGWYWVETTAFGRTVRDSVFVDGIVPEPQLNVFSDTTLCAGDVFTLEYTNSSIPADVDVLWSDGSTGTSVVVDTNATLSVMFSDATGCEAFSDTIVFDLNNFPLTEGLGVDRQECLNTNLYFEYGQDGIMPFTQVWEDGSTGPSFTLTTTGVNDYSIAVTDSMGCVANDTVSIDVLSIEAPVIEISNDTVCRFNPTWFYDASAAAVGDSITDFMWIFPDDTLYGDSVLYNANFADPYPVDLIIETEEGCQNRLRDTVAMFPQPVVGYNSPATICEGNEVNFISNQATPEQIILWEWEFETPSGSFDTDIGALGFYTFNGFGTFEVTVTGTDINGCQASETKNILVGENPTPDFDFTEVCAGNIVDFINTSTIATATISSQLWSFGDGTTSGQSSPSKPYLVPGNYDVELTVNGNNGCSADTTKTMKVHAIPQVDFVVDTICAGSDITFEDASLVQNGSVAQVFWDFGDGNEVEGFDVNHSFSNPGQQNVIQRVVSSFGCENTATQNVTVNDFLQAGFTIDPFALLANYPLTFENTSVGATTTIWEIDTLTTNQTTPEYTFSDDQIGDTVLISLTVTNEIGCSDNVSLELEVLERATDLAISQLFIQETNGFYTVGAELENKGTTPILNADLLLRTTNTPLIKESWSGLLEAGAKEIHIFQTQVPSTVQEEKANHDFICVEGQLISAFGFTDEDLSNNERCKSMGVSPQLTALLPYPNPIGEGFNLRVLMPEDAVVTIKAYDHLGRTVATIAEGESFPIGLSQFSVDAAHWAAGIYSIVMYGEGAQEVVKVVKE